MNVKAVAAYVLKKIGLYKIVRQFMIDMGLHKPVPHGHTLLIKAIDKWIDENGDTERATCIEIGSTRELLPSQGSTAEIARKCHEENIHFITVDMDPENTSSAEKTLAGICSSFQAINSKGEEFLKGFKDRVDFLYLDAFDIDHGLHSAERKKKYLKHLGTDINNEACYKMHLDCAKEAARLIREGGIVVFDDAWRTDSGWAGKGYSAMPYLLNNGFEVVEETANTLWLERKKT